MTEKEDLPVHWWPKPDVILRMTYLGFVQQSGISSPYFLSRPRAQDDSVLSLELPGLGFWRGHPTFVTVLLHGNIDASQIPGLGLQ